MKADDSKWVVIQMARSADQAEQLKRMLTEEGFMVRVRPVARQLASGHNYPEVTPPSSEAQAARDFLMAKGL